MFTRTLTTILILSAINSAQAQDPSEFECERQALETLHYLQDRNGVKDKDKIASDLARMQPWTEEHPDSWVIHYAVGVCALGTENLPLALNHLKVAFEKSEKDAQVGMVYMIALKASKKPLEAVELIKNLADANPQLPQLRFTYAVTLMGVQKYDEAYPIFQEYAKAKANTPNEDYGYLLGMLGECQLYLGKHAEANVSLTEANKLVKDAVIFMDLLGETQLKSGQSDLAESNFTRALEINNTVPSPLYYLGLISEKYAHEKARQYYQKALVEAEKRIQANSERGSDHYLLYQIYQRLGMQEKAEQYKKSAAELHFTHEAPWKPGVKPIP